MSAINNDSDSVKIPSTKKCRRRKMRHQSKTSVSTIPTALSVLLLIAFHSFSIKIYAEALDISQDIAASSHHSEGATSDRSFDIQLLEHDADLMSLSSSTPRYFHYPQLNASKIQNTPELSMRERWLRQSPALSRILDAGNNNNNNNGDDAAAYNDDKANYNDDDAADDAYNDDVNYTNNMQYICQDKTCTVNEQCTKFLFGFLEGTTDAKDNCEGISNAYDTAECGTLKKSSDYASSKSDAALYRDDDDFNDDYFGIFYDHQCCSSLRSHYYEYCDSSGLLNEFNLLVVAAVMLLCECAKSVVKKNNIHWLPEAGACMLVGMGMAGVTAVAGYSMEQFAFDEQIFMYILLPPIIFEAALTVNKREFRRRRGAIIIFAVFGTLISSFVTGAATYYTAKYFGENSLTMLDSLVFGSVISSIDPVAILSVLTNLHMSESDTIYIIVLGEALLNDGIAITLFKSLVQSYQDNSSVTADKILGSVADFLIIATGSFAVGLVCGFASLFYFLLNKSILHPVMEVASFFLWAVVPYWLAEAFGWSGIVAIVVMGFFMDMYLRPGWDATAIEEAEQERINRLMKLARAEQEKATESPHANMYYNWGDGEDMVRLRGTAVDLPIPGSSASDSDKPTILGPDVAHRSTSLPNRADATADNSVQNESVGDVKAIIMKREFVRLSREADEHVRFVAHILSSLSENAIFAYLGLFLFSSKYKWDALLCTIGTLSCVLSRAVMVIAATWFIWYLHVFRQRAGCQGVNAALCITPDVTNDEFQDGDTEGQVNPVNTPISKSARALSNYKVQIVLILAGLRGAVSLALVESVPIYNAVTGEGSKSKGLLKAMTSSAIIFTIFVLGGGAWYILKRLDITDEEMLIKTSEKDRDEPFLPAGLYCGGGDVVSQEMELTSNPSWRGDAASPSWRSRRPSRLSSFGNAHNFLNTPSPSQILRSRSDWSQVTDNAGLNALIERSLQSKSNEAGNEESASVTEQQII